MRRLRKPVLTIIVVLFSPAALADSPIDCVDPDIANTLLGTPGQGEVEIRRDIPSDFPTIAVPASFELIGSRSSAYFTVVAYKAASTVDDTRDGLKQLMEAGQWQAPQMNWMPFRTLSATAILIPTMSGSI